MDVDLAAGQHVAPRALAVHQGVVLERVTHISEPGDAGEVHAQPVPGPAALALYVGARAREVFDPDETAQRRALRRQRSTEPRHRGAPERPPDSGRKLRPPARARSLDGGELP